MKTLKNSTDASLNLTSLRNHYRKLTNFVDYANNMVIMRTHGTLKKESQTIYEQHYRQK